MEEIEELESALSEQVCTVLVTQLQGDTYLLEAEAFCLAFTFSSEAFEIRNLEVFQNGLGKLVVGVIHEYCEAYQLEVYASNVKSTAIGFWRKMGYEEGSGDGEYYKVT